MQRLVVIDKGRIVYDGTVAALKAGHADSRRVDIGFQGDFRPEILGDTPGCFGLERISTDVLRVHVADGVAPMSASTHMLERMIQGGLLIRFVQPLTPSLEAIVGQMTGSPLGMAWIDEKEGRGRC